MATTLIAGTEGTLITIGLACVVSIVSCLIAFEIRKRTIELRVTSLGTTDAVPFMLSLFFVLISVESIIFAIRLAARLTGNMQTYGALYTASQILLALTIVPQMFIVSYVFTEDMRKSRLMAAFFGCVVMLYTITVFAYGIHNSPILSCTLCYHLSVLPKIIYSYAIFTPAIIASSTLMIALIWVKSVSERYRIAMLALSFAIFYTATILELNNTNEEYLFLIRGVLAYSVLVAYFAYFPPKAIKVKCDILEVSHGTLYHVRKRDGLHYRVATTTLLFILMTVFVAMTIIMEYFIKSLGMPVANTVVEIISITCILVLVYSIIITLARFEVIDLGTVNLAIGSKDIELLKKSLEFTENDLVGLDNEVEKHLESMDDLFLEFVD